MASEIRVNKITHTAGVGTVTPNIHGIVVAGIVTANSFSGINSVTATSVHGTTIHGSGANLTNLPAANLTGTLPAISGANLTGLSGPEVYGFTGIGSNLQVRTTNGGADDITSAQYDAFEQVLFAPSGITFSINNSGNLIATF